MEYRIAVQCIDTETSKIGTFIRDETKQRVSPLFRSLVDLYPWMHDNKWKLDEYVENTFTPWRVTKDN